MPEIVVDKPKILDILPTKTPALSSTSDMPVVETRPDASNEGKPPELTKAAPDEGKTDETESATVTADETAASTEGEPKKPAKGVQKRLDELTRQREDAERRARAAEEREARILKLLEDRAAPPPPAPKEEAKPDTTDPEPERPVKSNFADPDSYEAAVLDYADQKASWTARKEVAAARAADEKARREQAQATEERTVREAHAGRVAKAKEKYADFTEVAESPDVEISLPMAHAIIGHELGAEIQYHLGKHKDEAARIRALPVALQLMELGNIAAGLRAPAPAAVAASATPAKSISKAPAPIATVEAAGTSAGEKSLEEMSMEEYAAARRPAIASSRKPGGRR